MQLLEAKPSAIAIVTTTHYPEWYPGKIKTKPTSDKVRGDLALRTIRGVNERGMHMVLVDGKSSDAFRDAVSSQGVTVHEETERGLSGSRRQGLRTASAIPEVKVIGWKEPEKVYLVGEITKAVQPIFQGKAEIVVPSRDARAFATYPEYQVVDEQRGNRVFNDILKRRGLRETDEPDLDAWFGPRFFKNTPEVADVFLHEYGYNHGRNFEYLIRGQTDQERAQHARELGQIYNPDLWAAALFLPLPLALHRGMRIQSVPVHYQHPTEQTRLETDPAEQTVFARKRDIQRKNILNVTAGLIKTLKGTDRPRVVITK